MGKNGATGIGHICEPSDSARKREIYKILQLLSVGIMPIVSLDG